MEDFPDNDIDIEELDCIFHVYLRVLVSNVFSDVRDNLGQNLSFLWILVLGFGFLKGNNIDNNQSLIMKMKLFHLWILVSIAGETFREGTEYLADDSLESGLI